ncbi:hypothetical protein HNP55_001160 [Paucibacter oligotrophus]|uniref:Uncharacterized protein n=1 Tax=Roseateles oligotrophus TaxID=1769250 RepID=A0A840L7K9_9BURK|nr:hypothetical protein [Roseateles oligotrophus]MBB4842645.1 hypothetical protein [Roseateles oligotrophus]
MTSIAFQRSGLASKFPSIRKFLANYVLGLQNWETEDLGSLKRYATEGGFPYPSPDGEGVWIYTLANANGDLARVSNAQRWIAIQSCLKGDPNYAATWVRAAAYEFWGARADHRFDEFMLQDFRNGGRPQYLGMLRLRSAVSGLARVFLLGWQQETLSLMRWVLSALPHGAYFDADETSHPRAQFFVLRLLASHFGLTMPLDPLFAHEEPIYEFLIEHWRTPDPSHLVQALLAALDRHTHQSVRAKRSGPEFDFPFDEDWYFPYEVLVVLKLRELAGLANPSAEALAHPLTATPLGRLSAPTPVYTDATLDGVVKRMREEFLDL